MQVLSEETLDLEIDPNVTFLDANKVIEGMCKAHYNAHNMGDARTCTHFSNIHGHGVFTLTETNTAKIDTVPNGISVVQVSAV